MNSLPLLLLIIIFTAVGGVLSVLAAGIFLLLPEKIASKYCLTVLVLRLVRY